MAAEPFVGLTLARVVRPWGRRGEVAAEILTDFPQRLTAIRKAWLYDGRKPPQPVRVLSCRIHIGQAIFHFEGSESINDAELLRGLEVQVPLAERAPLRAGQYYISELVGCTVWEQGLQSPTVRDEVPYGPQVPDEPGPPDRSGAMDTQRAASVSGYGAGDLGARVDLDDRTPGARKRHASHDANHDDSNDASNGGNDDNNVVPASDSPLGTVTDVQRIDPGGGNAAGSWVLAVATRRGELLIPLAAEICTRIDTAARRIEVQLPEGLTALNEAR